jgi:hypothetical protein
LPDSIEALNLDECEKIKKLEKFPTNLVDVIISQTLITETPVFPPSTKKITLIANHKLKKINGTFPDGLEEVVINQSHKIRDIPPYNDALQKIQHHECDIKTIYRLPPTLKVLIVSRNKISVLPPLPNSIYQLNISENPFKYPPPYPSMLKFFYANDTKIKDFRVFPPNTEIVKVRNTPVKKLMGLPPTIKEVNVAGTSIMSTKKLNFVPEVFIRGFAD